MFKIQDGREYFFQWDLDRKLIVEDSTINQVHFCNKTDNCSLVCDVYTEGETRLVNVPNKLLQDSWCLYVYGYDSNYTKHEKRIDVKPRSKPEDYIYTETEVKTWEELESRVEGAEEAIKGLEEKEVDLTGYATEQFVKDAIGAIDIPEVDLTGYATEEYVDNAISGGGIPVVEITTPLTLGAIPLSDAENAKFNEMAEIGTPFFVKVKFDEATLTLPVIVFELEGMVLGYYLSIPKELVPMSISVMPGENGWELIAEPVT